MSFEKWVPGSQIIILVVVSLPNTNTLFSTEIPLEENKPTPFWIHYKFLCLTKSSYKAASHNVFLQKQLAIGFQFGKGFSHLIFFETCTSGTWAPDNI